MASSPKRLKTEEEDVVEETNTENVDVSDEYVINFKEEDVGISQFLNNHRGFSGAIKQRFSDFVVHEINLEGQDVQLTNCDLVPELTDPNAALIKPLSELINEEQLQKLRDLEKSATVEIDVTNFDKEKRTSLHKSIKSEFQHFNSNTIDKNGLKLVVVTRGRNQRVDNRKRWPFPGDFTHFTVYFESRGTIDVCQQIATHLQYKPSGFNYAGLKDKRAIASQRMSLWRTHPSKLLSVNDKFQSHSFPLVIGNFGFEHGRMQVGDLYGNRFELILRDVSCDEQADISTAFENIRQNGFINYFGKQRFGTGNGARTHQVGLAILREKWSEAIDLILTERSFDRKSRFGSSFNDCMKLWKDTHDAKELFKKFVWKKSNEGLIFKRLAESPNDFYGAMFSLPRNNRSIYVHAYQSLLWNKTASERIRKHGTKVLEGDLVITDDQATLLEDDLTGLETDSKGDSKRLSDKRKRFEPEIAKGDLLKSATIFDVVLPLPGTETKFPANETGEYLIDLIKQDQVDFKWVSKRSAQFMFPGAYRKLICKPKEITYKQINYDSDECQLIETDLHRLNGTKLELPTSGEKLAVKVNLILPSSSYATQFLRELLKKDSEH